MGFNKQKDRLLMVRSMEGQKSWCARQSSKGHRQDGKREKKERSALKSKLKSQTHGREGERDATTKFLDYNGWGTGPMCQRKTQHAN